MMKRWREVDEPAMRRRDVLNNLLLDMHYVIHLRWNPLTPGIRKLKHGAKYGILIKILAGGALWRVLPDGYKHPQDFHPAFWEVLIS